MKQASVGSCRRTGRVEICKNFFLISARCQTIPSFSLVLSRGLYLATFDLHAVFLVASTHRSLCVCVCVCVKRCCQILRQFEWKGHLCIVLEKVSVGYRWFIILLNCGSLFFCWGAPQIRREPLIFVSHKMLKKQARSQKEATDIFCCAGHLPIDDVFMTHVCLSYMKVAKVGCTRIRLRSDECNSIQVSSFL